MLASFVAVPRVASNASRRVVGQWGGAGGAICEDHLAFGGERKALAVALFVCWPKNRFPSFCQGDRRVTRRAQA